MRISSLDAELAVRQRVRAAVCNKRADERVLGECLALCFYFRRFEDGFAAASALTLVSLMLRAIALLSREPLTLRRQLVPPTLFSSSWIIVFG